MRLSELRPVSVTRASALAVGGLLVSACGPAEPPPPALAWLELEPVDASESPPEEALIAHLEAEDFGAWDYQGAAASMERAPFGPHVHLASESAMSATIPDELPADRLLRVSVVLKPLARTVMSVSFDGGGTPAAAEDRLLRPTKGPVLEAFDLPPLSAPPGEVGGAGRVRLSFPEGGAVRVYGVMIHDIPPVHRYASAQLASLEPFAVEGELRNATCLWQTAGLRAHLTPAPGQRLGFSFALPAELQSGVERPVLTATLSAEGREPERHLFEPEPGASSSAWRSCRVPLEGWEGTPATVTWVLEPAGTGSAAMLTQPRLELPVPEAPTVLLITSDTHRADHLGVARNAVEIRTDTLDRLAGEGVVFDDVLASINNTAPSHVALLTGTSPRDTGVIQNGEGISSAPLTLADSFRAAGYVTLASVSAPPVTHALSGLAQGFEQFSEPTGRPRRGADTIARVLGWLPEYEGVPVFVWLHFFDAHTPYRPPPGYERMYYPAEKDPYDASAPGAAPELAPDWSPKIADPLFTEALYRAEISYLDDMLADLLAQPRMTQAVVAFTADHGEILSRGATTFNHAGLSPATLEVPLILRAPGLVGGRRVTRPVRQLDVGRTLLDLAGLREVPFPGVDLLAATEQASTDQPRFALEAGARTASVHSGRWMLRMSLENPPGHSVELFDVLTDPYLEQDVAGMNPEAVKPLRRLLVKWLLDAANNPWARTALEDPEEVAAQLAELGYVTVERDVASNRWIEPDCDCPECAKYRQ